LFWELGKITIFIWVFKKISPTLGEIRSPNFTDTGMQVGSIKLLKYFLELFQVMKILVSGDWFDKRAKMLPGVFSGHEDIG